VQNTYETTMSEWLAVEAIIHQRDKEVITTVGTRLSYGSQSIDQLVDDPHECLNMRLSNEVTILKFRKSVY
jgi:hypothetical protein